MINIDLTVYMIYKKIIKITFMFLCRGVEIDLKPF